MTEGEKYWAEHTNLHEASKEMTWIKDVVIAAFEDGHKTAEIYRDCFENEQNTFKSEQILARAVMAQHRVAMVALRKIAGKPGRFATSLCARQAIAVIEDGRKSQIDWSNEYKT